MKRQAHWDRVYETKGPAEVSWYQPDPTLSLRLIEAAGFTPTTWIIDVGGGDARLVDRLLERDAQCVTVLDVSPAALARSKSRLGQAHTRVTWIAADVTSDWHVDAVDLWHDRAVFHFLTDPIDRAKYIERLSRTLKRSGTIILATFAPDGPEKCSGLPVLRYDPATLGAEVGAGFALVDAVHEQHRTPGGAMQSFWYAVFRRGGS